MESVCILFSNFPLSVGRVLISTALRHTGVIDFHRRVSLPTFRDTTLCLFIPLWKDVTRFYGWFCFPGVNNEAVNALFTYPSINLRESYSRAASNRNIQWVTSDSNKCNSKFSDMLKIIKMKSTLITFHWTWYIHNTEISTCSQHKKLQ